MPNDRRESHVTALVLDVMGTVVDLDATVHQAVADVFSANGMDEALVPAFAQDWGARLQRLIDDVVAGERPWRAHQELRRSALTEAAVAIGRTDLPAEALDRLTTVVHRATVWPDSAAALDRLRVTHTVVALSNADFGELVDLSRSGGLAWHGVISAAASHSFKPDRAVYTNALSMLGVDAPSIMMVAAHPWDLRAAARVGMATAFVARPGSEPPDDGDHFDLEVGSLAELADRLAD